MFKRKYSFLVLLLIIVFLFIGVRFGLAPSKAVNDDVISLIWQITAPFKFFFHSLAVSLSNIFSLGYLRQQNDQLISQLQATQLKLLEQKDLLKENQLLKEALHLKEEEGFKSLIVKVLFTDPEGITGNIIVNRGRKDGIKEGMNVVLNDKILVGRIKEVSEDFSVVETIYRPTIKISAQDARSKTLGLVEREENGVFAFKLLPSNADITVGDLLITSIENKQFVRGLMIGEISEVFKNSQSLTQTVNIKEPFRLADLDQVLILISPFPF